MPIAFGVLIGLQLVGEVLRRMLHLPVPGPLIGMVLLTALLAIRGGGDAADKGGDAAEKTVPLSLSQLANGLIANMGLLFIPAGVGIIAEFGVLRQAWPAILAGLLVSTVLGVAVTGLVMHHVSRAEAARRRPMPVAAAE